MKTDDNIFRIGNASIKLSKFHMEVMKQCCGVETISSYNINNVFCKTLEGKSLLNKIRIFQIIEVKL
jgi:hypothetical protein